MCENKDDRDEIILNYLRKTHHKPSTQIRVIKSVLEGRKKLIKEIVTEEIILLVDA